MLPPENADPLDGPAWSEELAEAGVYRSEGEAFEHGLVVLALGFPYWLVPYEGGFRLLVPNDSLASSRSQLELFDRESQHWPPRSFAAAEAPKPPSVIGPLLWVLATIGVFRAQEQWPEDLERWGMLDAEKVFSRGEVWRIATALWLHADIAHLTANLVSGFFIFSAVLTQLGRVRGTLLVILSALLGNAAVVSLNWSNAYRSLGASTAVFGGLGVLTGAALARVIYGEEKNIARSLFTPLAAGLTLLGLFGAGELHTDVAAHACGFAAGVLGGVIGGTEKKVPRR